MGFFGFGKKLIHQYVFFTLKIVHNGALYDSMKTACLGKIWFFSYVPKCSQPIKLHHQYLRKQSVENLVFWVEITVNEMKDLKLPLLVGCGQLCLSSNQIAGFFHH